jgi:pyrroline-5-carboxylate reductase
MSGYKNFAFVGAGTTGSFIVRQFLEDKAAGTVNEVVVLTRQVSSAVSEM